MKHSFSRTTALIAGTVILLANGVIYAWSIYSSPFPEGFGWTSAQLGTCFTVIMAGFCLGGVMGSVITSRLGVRFSVPIGGIMGALGYLLSMFLTAKALWLLYLSFAVSSLGVGAVYNSVISTVVARFPDKKGAASGCMMMGFGASTLLLGSLAGRLIESPAVGWHLTYIMTGALLLVVAFAGVWFLIPPKESGDGGDTVSISGMSPGAMVRQPRFWVVFLIGIIGCGFGSGVIGHARYIALAAGSAASLATLAVGLLSVCNGLGRIIFGLIHDKRGYRMSMRLQAILYLVAGLTAVLALSRGSAVLIVAALMVCGLAYGSVPVIMSSVTGEFFGRRFYGVNFSIMNLSILPAAFAASVAGTIQTATGSYIGAFWLFLALEAVAGALMILLKKMQR